MSDESVLPFLSQFDPREQAEGSLDPLGLYSIADALGVLLAPGVRERQSRPRFLTLALIGMAACTDELTIIGDSKGLPAWLVYEWLVVQALVWPRTGTPTLQGIPGRDKVLAALADGVPVGTNTYLKTPTVFGFHGVYKVLGTKAGLFDVELHPLDLGYRVLKEWEAEQGLSGLVGAGHGPGRELRRLIQSKIRSGLQSGYSDPPGAELRQLIQEHMNPHAPGSTESSALWAALATNDPMRKEFMERITSTEGQGVWRNAGGSERVFLHWMAINASLQLRGLLDAIEKYETFSRLLTDAFDEVRWRMTQERAPVTMQGLGGGRAVQFAHKQCSSAYRDASRALAEIDPRLQMRLERNMSWIGEASNPAAFATHLMEHHRTIQKAKPPGGKRSWFDTFQDGRSDIRQAYKLDDFLDRGPEFVHAYRTVPLWSFARDLGRVSHEAESN